MKMKKSPRRLDDKKFINDDETTFGAGVKL